MAVDDEEEEEDGVAGGVVGKASAATPDAQKFSESLSLFQSLQVT